MWPFRRHDLSVSAPDRSASACRGDRGLRFTALIVGLGLLAVGCSSKGEAAKSDAKTEAAILAFTQCIRGQGITDMPDPTVDSKGNVRIQRPPSANDSNPAAHDRFVAARNACADTLKGVTQGFTHGNDAQSQDQLLKLAQCMRGKGIDVPDPDFSAQEGGHSGTGDLFGGAIDRSDPEVQKALSACEIEVYGSSGSSHGEGH
jgi:hypothetical protein